MTLIFRDPIISAVEPVIAQGHGPAAQTVHGAPMARTAIPLKRLRKIAVAAGLRH